MPLGFSRNPPHESTRIDDLRVKLKKHKLKADRKEIKEQQKHETKLVKMQFKHQEKLAKIRADRSEKIKGIMKRARA